MLHFVIKFVSMMYINTGVFMPIVRTGFVQESFISSLCISSEMMKIRIMLWKNFLVWET